MEERMVRKLLAALFALLIVATSALAEKQIVTAGATSQRLDIFIQDSSSTTGAGLTGLTNASGSLVCYYHRNRAATATQISLVSATVGTFTSSGFIAVDGTNMPGVYQLDPPDAAFAAGADSVTIMCKGATNMAPTVLEVQLSTFDLATATQSVNVAASGIGSTAIADGALTEAKFAATGNFTTGGTATQWPLAATETSSKIGGQTICDVTSKQCRRCNQYNTSTKVCTVDGTGPDGGTTITPTSGQGYTIGGLQGSIGTDQTVNANTTQWNGSNVATPNFSGKPVVDLDTGTGAGQVQLSSGNMTVGDIVSSALAKFFTVNTAQTSGTAVTGSVVKESIGSAATATTTRTW